MLVQVKYFVPFGVLALDLDLIFCEQKGDFVIEKHLNGFVC
jgi:hypothetical protein